MSKTAVGEIKQMTRYPIKSFAGENVELSRIESYGLYGDRSHAFTDESKVGWARYFTARQAPGLLRFQAQLIGEGDAQQFPDVRVQSPDGRCHSWDEHLLEEIQALSSRKLSMLRYQPGSEELLAVDTASILIITDATVRKLERVWGKPLDHRRFRANLVIAAGDDYSINEFDWIGKRLVIGSSELKVEMPCERCSMITIDPDTLEYDTSLLRKVKEEMDLHFGVYASVSGTGQIKVGDKVYLMDETD